MTNLELVLGVFCLLLLFGLTWAISEGRKTIVYWGESEDRSSDCGCPKIASAEELEWDNEALEFRFVKWVCELEAIEESKDYGDRYTDRVIELKSKIAGIAYLIGYERVVEILSNKYECTEEGSNNTSCTLYFNPD